MVKNLKTTILDVGGRYGIHPTWKKFSGEKKIFLVEPDKEEYNRLKKKSYLITYITPFVIPYLIPIIGSFCTGRK